MSVIVHIEQRRREQKEIGIPDISGSHRRDKTYNFIEKER
jgi:hypothetical protein